jgi:hypothetical protein
MNRDPIFAVIDRHRRAVAALSGTHHREADEQREVRAFEALATTKATTRAGTIAMIERVLAGDRGKCGSELTDWHKTFLRALKESLLS